MIMKPRILDNYYKRNQPVIIIKTHICKLCITKAPPVRTGANAAQSCWGILLLRKT